MNKPPADTTTCPPKSTSAKKFAGFTTFPPSAQVLMPVSIERGVWEYFSGKAEQRGIRLSELVTDVLKLDVKINEALKEDAHILDGVLCHADGGYPHDN